jgi:polyphenol oxidase
VDTDISAVKKTGTSGGCHYPPEMVFAVSRIHDGNMSLRYGQTDGALSNRSIFLKRFSMDSSRLVCAGQVHGSSVVVVTDKDAGRGAESETTVFPSTDGIITESRKLPLTVFTADCLSVALFDPVKPAVAVIHAGWRGTKEHIVVKALELMSRCFCTNPAEVRAFLGPCIRQCCYEIGKECADFFPEQVFARGGRYYLDLAGENREQLIGMGVDIKSIDDCRVCTRCSGGEFFSYRNDGPETGRMMSVVMLK